MAVQIGTRVYSSLYNRGEGIVYAVHGTPLPQNVRFLPGGVVSMGGRASFDIVFLDGSTTQKLPESILYGVQWRILDNEPLATQEEIGKALTFAAAKKTAQQAAEESAKKAFDEAVSALRADPRFAHLSQGEDAATASKNLRRVLKDTFPGVKFSVRLDRASMMTALRIEWTGGPSEKAVEEIAFRFKDGNFDCMEDLYVYSSTPWNTVFGGAKYVSTRRHRASGEPPPCRCYMQDDIPGDHHRDTCPAYLPPEVLHMRAVWGV